MKKLLLLSLLALSALAAHAQTNIQVRVTVDGVNATINLDSTGSKKDVNRIAGIAYAYGVYTNSLATNQVPLTMPVWLRTQHTVLIDDYASQKQARDNATIAAKIVSLLTANSDLLTAGDLSNLNTIAAKAP